MAFKRMRLVTYFIFICVVSYVAYIFNVSKAMEHSGQTFKGLFSWSASDQNEWALQTFIRRHFGSAFLFLPACPPISPNLGLRTADVSDVRIDDLEKMFSLLKPGGHYSPPDCQPDQKTAIIIPYRNRWSHLKILLHNLIPFLVRQKVSFSVFVVEMEEPTSFNRALLLNVGVLEALKIDNYNCFIFHDVDLIPLSDSNYYGCSHQPRQLAVALNIFNYTVKFKNYFGGVTAFSREQIEKINGCSNLYFGWGGEDDDILRRVKAKRMNVSRDPLHISRYDMISHKRDEGNEINPTRFALLQNATARLALDGLSSVRYHLKSLEFKPLYTWLKIFVNMTEVFMSAPPYERAILMANMTQNGVWKIT